MKSVDLGVIKGLELQIKLGSMTFTYLKTLANKK